MPNFPFPFNRRRVSRRRAKLTALTQVARFGAVGLPAALMLATPTVAHADIVGRLQITITDAETGKPVRGAVVTLTDTAGVSPNVQVVTDASGNALTPPLENRGWRLATTSQSYTGDTRVVTVAPDTTTIVPIKLSLEVKQGGVSRITVSPGNRAASDTQRNSNFIAKLPSTGNNPQSLPRLLITTPGFVQSTVNAVHPRGEHASTSIYIDGFLLPGVLQGRAGPQISPDIIQNADIITGGYAPEYGSETAAILNLTLKAGPITPFRELTLGYGDYGTYDQILTLGGQEGAPVSAGSLAKKFRYFLNIDHRSTSSALETPQPDNQTAHNYGEATTFFGNFDYLADPRNTFSLYVADSPATTEIGNRTGLGSFYSAVGQGYGFGGARNADGSEAGVSANSGLLGSGVDVLGSQQADHQNIFQDDENGFTDLNYRHTFNNNLTSLLSVGFNKSRLDIRNNNPSIDGNSFNSDGTLTTTDNSIEYNPTVLRKNTQTETSGSLTYAKDAHTYKAGFVAQDQIGDESYAFVSESQLALDALAAIQQGGPQLTPNGTFELDAGGNQVLDVLGNPVYLATPGAATPTVEVHRQGYYAAGYLQDTWNASRRLTINYGARLDSYGQRQSIGDSLSKVNEAYLGPRLNTAYLVTPDTTLRLIYDKMYTQPPLSEGSIVGRTLKPETFDLYETSLEKALTPGQSVKVDYYYKNVRNQDDTGLFIPYTQIGAYTTLQYQYASIHGLEFSYLLTPRGMDGSGLGGYLSYAHSHAAPGGLDQDGDPAPTVNDHDQADTLSLGVDYTLKSQAFAGADFYYGSGEASSVLAAINPSNSNVLSNGARINHNFLNLRFGSGPVLPNASSLQLDVDNVFNSVSVENFNSGFSGTRFQEGRRVMLSLTTKL